MHCAGNDASLDVLPVANSLQFVTNATEQSFVLTILPDDIPELDEVSTCARGEGHDIMIVLLLHVGVFC